ncbi:hypothetical protein [Bermanella sp. R86510]|uniref:hypothetical protein n=1 Tax=unclassified Bermanella TaxID=2627862 RepID=UPI0037C5E6FB
MLASKVLFGFSIYLFYRFASYFYSFIESGFPSWGDDLVVGNTTINLFFAPYGALLALAFVSILLFVSGRDLYIYYFSNVESFARVKKIEYSTDDMSSTAPIDIVVEIEGETVVIDFLNANLKDYIKEGDSIPVRYVDGRPQQAMINEKKLLS